MPLKNGNQRAGGGKRLGAGRKATKVEELKAKIATDVERAKEYIEGIRQLAEGAEQEKVRLQAYVYLTDRILGKPRDPKDISGELVVKIQGYSPDIAG